MQTFSILLTVTILGSFSVDGTVIYRIPIGKNVNITELRDDFINSAFTAQNCYRAKHQAEPLTLDSEVSSVAQSWADQLAMSGNMQHSGGNYGENLFGGSSVTNGELPIYYWYKECEGYNYGSESMGQAGHFTQLVWKGSKRVGFGVGQGTSWVFVVANYDPPGNMMGAFAENVSPPSDNNINSCVNIQQSEFLSPDSYQVL